MQAEELSKSIFNRLPQEYRRLEQYSLNDGSSSECENMMHEGKDSESLLNPPLQRREQPVSDIYLHPSASDDSSISTLGFLSSLSPQAVSRQIPSRIKGSWNDEKIVTLLCLAVFQ